MKNSEPFVLKVVDKCVKPFLSKDLNYSQVREMLRLKLIMDSLPGLYGLRNFYRFYAGYAKYVWS